MNRLARLLREMTPAWMLPAGQQADDTAEVIPFRPKSELCAGEADDVWRNHVEKGLFGADTSDYSGVPEAPDEPELPGLDSNSGSSKR